MSKKQNVTRQARLESRAKILKALAHPSRLLMVEELAGGEKCVCELQAAVGADMSTVSKHLSVLKRAGLIADRKHGLWVHYRLLSPCVLNFFGCVENVIRVREGRAPARPPQQSRP
jgi:DNA-binding transcriptional ArsR family regulator